MRYLTLILLLLFVFSGNAAHLAANTVALSGDSVVIEKKKVVLVRPAALVKDFPERKRATVSYPVITGGLSPAVLRKVRALLQVKNIFDTSLEEYKADTWLEEFDYEVNYNKNYILDITFTQTGTAAYPDTHTKHLAINLKTGNLIKAGDVFKPESLNALAAMVDQKLQDEIRKTRAETAGDMNQEERESMAEMYSNLKFGVEQLDEFSINEKGVTFLYDAGFPHAVQALEPIGQYSFSYAELSAHIKSEGLLGKFVQ